MQVLSAQQKKELREFAKTPEGKRFKEENDRLFEAVGLLAERKGFAPGVPIPFKEFDEALNGIGNYDAEFIKTLRKENAALFREHSAEENARFRDARMRTIVEHVFFGSFVNNLEIRPSRHVPTAATNGKVIIYNPFWSRRNSTGAVYGLLLHEVAHVALGHDLRRGDRDPRAWNVACDYVINAILKDIRITLPKGALYDPRYDGMSAEQVYAELAKRGGPTEGECEEGERGRVDDRPTRERNKRGKKQQQKESEDEKNESEDEGDEGSDGDDVDPDEQDGKKKGKSEGKGKGNKGNESEDSGDEGAGDGGDGGDGDDSDTGDSEGSGQKQRSTTPQSADEVDFDEGEEKDALDDIDEEDDFGYGDEQDNPYGEGSDQDLGDEPELPTQLEAETDWKLKVAQAELVAKGVGGVPGSMTCELENIKQEKVDWKSALCDLLTEVQQEDYSYSRPNKLFPSGEGQVIHPSLYNESVGPIVIGVDTSGSRWSQDVMDRTAAEITAILSAFQFPAVHVVYCDTAVRHVDEYGPNDVLDFKPHGGGGTEFIPVFQWIEQEGINPAALIYITDLEIYAEDYPREEPSYKTIWAAMDASQYYRKQVPFGHVLDIDTHDKSF